jgi:hypothetical protein
MDQREGARKPADLDTVIENVSDASAGTLAGRIRNISLSGLYLEMPVEGVSRYARLRLNLGGQADRPGQLRAWNCRVIRVTESGVGAMFESADPADTDGLLDLLREASAGGDDDRH